MKRTKEWWGTLTVEQRSRLVFLERCARISGVYGGGGYLPDNCCECVACSTPHPGNGLCPYCVRELYELIEIADKAILQKHRIEKQKEEVAIAFEIYSKDAAVAWARTSNWALQKTKLAGLKFV